jgi:tRNA(Leu) C34 or U34 (ribose-2'-O)-methylase TrmL
MILPKQERIIKTPGIILNNPKYAHNVAAAIRACSCFGVSTMLWTGKRVDTSTMERLPREERMKGYKDVYWETNEKPFDAFHDAVPVCVEIVPNAENLASFTHPKNALYVFGPEDGSVSQIFKRFCHWFIYIPSAHCLNLSAAINVVLYDRRAKRIKEGLDPNTLETTLQEQRGGIIDIEGWDGK